MKAYAESQKARMIELHLAGVLDGEIARRLGVSQNGVSQFLRRNGYPAHTQGGAPVTGIMERLAAAGCPRDVLRACLASNRVPARVDPALELLAESYEARAQTGAQT